MIAFTLRRLASAIPTLLVLAALTFFMLRLAPGGPFDAEHAFPPEIQQNIDARYGLDQPLPQQFIKWAEDLLKGDLRESFQYTGRPVTEIIAEGLPTSLGLGIGSLFLALLLGIPLGVLAAWQRGTWLDFSAIFLSIAGISLPSYLAAALLVLVFSIGLGWLPPALWEGPSSAILPILTLSLRPLAMISRMLRASMVEVSTADFIRTAQAKGLSPFHVLFRHVLRNSFIPLIGALGPLTAHLVTGSFLVETVFQIPGLGKHFVGAVLNRDYPLVMGVTLVYGAILLITNVLVDLIYGWADPRIRFETEAS